MEAGAAAGSEVGFSLGATAGDAEGGALGLEGLGSEDEAGRLTVALWSASHRDFLVLPAPVSEEEAGPLPPDPLGFFMD